MYIMCHCMVGGQGTLPGTPLTLGYRHGFIEFSVPLKKSTLVMKNKDPLYFPYATLPACTSSYVFVWSCGRILSLNIVIPIANNSRLDDIWLGIWRAFPTVSGMTLNKRQPL